MIDKWIIVKWADDYEPSIEVFTLESEFNAYRKMLKDEREIFGLLRGHVYAAKVIEEVEDK